MNTFAPYKVLEDTNQRIHLALDSFRKVMLFIATRLFPLAFLVGAIISLANANDDQTPFVVFIGVLAFMSVLVLIAIKYPIEAIIDRQGFVIRYKMFFQVKERSIALADVETIRYKIMRGKHGGLAYSIVLKNGTSYRLFKISRWYMDSDRELVINNKLADLTGLAVKKSSSIFD